MTKLSWNLSFDQKSQFSVLCHLAGFQHLIYKANASFSMLIFSKGRPWGRNVIVEIDLGNLLRTDSRGFMNLYCDWYLSYRFAQCVTDATHSKMKIILNQIQWPKTMCQLWSRQQQKFSSIKFSRIEYKKCRKKKQLFFSIGHYSHHNKGITTSSREAWHSAPILDVLYVLE